MTPWSSYFESRAYLTLLTTDERRERLPKKVPQNITGHPRVEAHLIQAAAVPGHFGGGGKKDIRHIEHPPHLGLQLQRQGQHHPLVLPPDRSAQLIQQALQGLPEGLRLQRDGDDIQRGFLQDKGHKEGDQLRN